MFGLAFCRLFLFFSVLVNSKFPWKCIGQILGLDPALESEHPLVSRQDFQRPFANPYSHVSRLRRIAFSCKNASEEPYSLIQIKWPRMHTGREEGEHTILSVERKRWAYYLPPWTEKSETTADEKETTPWSELGIVSVTACEVGHS